MEGWRGLTFSYLLDDNSVNETKENETIIKKNNHCSYNENMKAHGMGSVTEEEPVILLWLSYNTSKIFTLFP